MPPPPSSRLIHLFSSSSSFYVVSVCECEFLRGLFESWMCLCGCVRLMSGSMSVCVGMLLMFYVGKLNLNLTTNTKFLKSYLVFILFPRIHDVKVVAGVVSPPYFPLLLLLLPLLQLPNDPSPPYSFASPSHTPSFSFVSNPSFFPFPSSPSVVSFLFKHLLSVTV